MAVYDHWHVDITGADVSHQTMTYQERGLAERVAERTRMENPIARVTVRACGPKECAVELTDLR